MGLCETCATATGGSLGASRADGRRPFSGSRESTQLVLIPSYNTGPRLQQTVREARRFWTPVWLIIDGSTDGTGEGLARLAADDPGLHLLIRPDNAGKGAALLDGFRHAAAAGFTHALTMDADGQHPAAAIPEFMSLSAANPQALILGLPIFDGTAPSVRVKGRKVSNWLARAETLGADIGDALCGFRVYPIEDLLAVMSSSRWMRGFDFDPEAAVRLVWRGLPLVNRSVPVRYLRPEEGGVSHFNYLRDNLLLAWMHFRLLGGLVRRLPRLMGGRVRSFLHSLR
jgi:glycosyltransferase involved in cell wall biosynthesis